jgi:hypothetical protein
MVRALARIDGRQWDLRALEAHEFVGQLVRVQWDAAQECNVLVPVAPARL